MSDNTHVTDVGGLVHKGPDLIYGEVTEDIFHRQRRSVSGMIGSKKSGTTYTMMSNFSQKQDAEKKISDASSTTRTQYL